VRPPPKDPYAKLITNSQFNGGEDAPFEDKDDKYRPYHEIVGEHGGYNEWKDQKFPWSDKIKSLNRSVFKNADFLEGQQEIINAALSKRDVMALIPTGGGKSLTF